MCMSAYSVYTRIRINTRHTYVHVQLVHLSHFLYVHDIYQMYARYLTSAAFVGLRLTFHAQIILLCHTHQALAIVY
jgi:hypothetical protein